MTTSSITSVTFDQNPPVYAPGAPVTMTVKGSWTTPLTITVATADGATGTGTLNIVQPVTASDPGNHTWKPTSNTGTVAVLTTTA